MLDSVKQLAYKHFQTARGSHKWDHTLRVCRLCERIAMVERVDMDVLLAAAYLHDIRTNPMVPFAMLKKGRRWQDPL